MTIFESVLDAVGGTPLIRLNRVTAGITATVYVKAEFLNPGGSVKDRAALWMVDQAERDGSLRPGGTIVEGTSGNTGVGLAQIAAQRGYWLIVVVADKTSAEKQDNLDAYGAELVITPSGLPREHPEHVNNVAERLASTIDGAWLANQYDNPANPRAHRESTGPEVLADTAGLLTHFVASIGTGGTITGTGGYLKSVSGGSVTVVGADPLTSVYSGGDGSPFFIEAAGHYLHPDSPEDVWPESFHPDVVDRIVPVSDRESILTARRLAKEEGLLVGGSAGLAVAAGLRVAAELTGEHTVVILLPDSGRSYLSKYHSDSWLRHLGFLDDDRGELVIDAVEGDPGLDGTWTDTSSPSTPLSIPSSASIGQALHIAAANRGSLEPTPVVLPRAPGGLPAAVSEVLGVVNRDILQAEILSGSAERPVLTVAQPAVFVGTGESAPEAVAALNAAGTDRALVLRDGRLAGWVNRNQLRAVIDRPTEATGSQRQEILSVH